MWLNFDTPQSQSHQKKHHRLEKFQSHFGSFLMTSRFSFRFKFRLLHLEDQKKQITKMRLFVKIVSISPNETARKKLFFPYIQEILHFEARFEQCYLKMVWFVRSEAATNAKFANVCSIMMYLSIFRDHMDDRQTLKQRCTPVVGHISLGFGKNFSLMSLFRKGHQYSATDSFISLVWQSSAK